MLLVPRSLLFFCRDPDDPARLQMLYPICVSQCPQGELLACPRNLRHATTTTTTLQTTADPGIYVPILDTRGGGLPYAPYEVETVYSAYPSQQSFAYPYYRETPHFQPILYPPATRREGLSEACPFRSRCRASAAQRRTMRCPPMLTWPMAPVRGHQHRRRHQSAVWRRSFSVAQSEGGARVLGVSTRLGTC